MAIVGIDLGTTNSAVATLWMGRPEILPNRYGGCTTPSVVAQTKQGNILVGQKAKHQWVSLVGVPIAEIKRKMGQNVTISLGDKQCTPQQISSYILQYLKEDAQTFLKEKVGCAIITIPAYFNESARRATREAGELAGLHVGMILDEPTAAALAYGVKGDRKETVLIYDLGGGTLDVSIIEITQNHFEVLAIDGNAQLGGRDFDRLLCDYVCQTFKEMHKLDLRTDAKLMSRLWVAVEAVKCDLSYRMDSSVIIEAITDKDDIDIPVKRELLEELVRPLVASSVVPIQRALSKANLEPGEISHVLLVGGSTRMPLVRETVSKFFGREPRQDINPDLCVALGAAVYTSLLNEETKKQFGMQEKWRPQDGSSDSLVVVPRTAHALGIGVDEGGSRFSVVLPASSFYPVSVTRKEYYTAIANQAGIEFWVYEGDNPLAQKNMPLGIVRLDLPERLPAGVPIWITFTLNVSRILEVTVELPSRPGLKARVRIEACGSVAPAEDSEHEQSRLEHQLAAIAKLLNDYQQDIAQSRRASIEWALNSARESLAQGDLPRAIEKVHMLEHVRDELNLLENEEA
jgi:molecular chaperone DnaK